MKISLYLSGFILIASCINTITGKENDAGQYLVNKKKFLKKDIIKLF